jgi:peptidoglycan/LPS O-acetylase OafA/YrhL
MTAGPFGSAPGRARLGKALLAFLRRTNAALFDQDTPSLASAAGITRTAYRPDIDGLRAVAVLAVVFYHAGLSFISGGFIGVDIFFVISGYVISKSLLADLDNGRFSILGFYERRVRRIFPALFVTMIATWLVALILFLPSYLLDYSKSLVACATFLSNVYFWKNSGYFSNGANLRPLLHTWSLSVEEQFYLFAPLTLFLIYRFFNKRWATILTPLMLASLALSVFAERIGPTANFFLLPTRAWELLLGALLSLSPLPPLKQPWARQLLALVGVALLIWPVFAYSQATPFPGLAAVPPCLGAALLIYVGSGTSAQSGSLATRILSTPPFVGVGLISYSLYLVHWPLVSFFTYYALRPPGPREGVVIVCASLVLAVASWRFVESPLRAKSFHPGRSALLGGGAAAMAFGAALGAVVIFAGGLPGRFPHVADRVAHADWDGNPCFLGNNPDPRQWKQSSCVIADGNGPTALLWGDSYADHYAAGIRANAPNIPYRILEYTAAGCPPVLSYTAYNRPNCQKFNLHALAIIKQNDVKTVIIAARWVDLQRRGLGELRSTLGALSALGVRTYVIGQSPLFTTDVHVIASRRPAGGRLDFWPVSFDPAMNEQLAALAGPGNFVDPLAHLCRGGSCPYRDRGQLLFADEGHFNDAGSLWAVASYFPLVDRSPKSTAPPG